MVRNWSEVGVRNSELELESELSSEVVEKLKRSHVQIVKMSESEVIKCRSCFNVGVQGCKNVGESRVGVTERSRSSEYSNGIGVKGRKLVGVRSLEFGVPKVVRFHKVINVVSR